MRSSFAAYHHQKASLNMLIDSLCRSWKFDSTAVSMAQLFIWWQGQMIVIHQHPNRRDCHETDAAASSPFKVKLRHFLYIISFKLRFLEKLRVQHEWIWREIMVFFPSIWYYVNNNMTFIIASRTCRVNTLPYITTSGCTLALTVIHNLSATLIWVQSMRPAYAEEISLPFILY